MNKKVLTGGALWLCGLGIVANNQTNDVNAANNVQSTMKPVIINEQQEHTKIIKTENGFKQLTRVIDTIETTSKPKSKTKTTKKSTKKSSSFSKSTKSSKLYTNIPFSARFQCWIDDMCKEYGISTNVVMAVIWKESNFHIRAMGDHGEAYGLMQIQKKWHKARMRRCDAEDLLNCYDNVHVGIDYLAELYRTNNRNWHKTLMAYNGGQAYADKKVKRGIYSSDYSRKVMNKANQYKKERND